MAKHLTNDELVAGLDEIRGSPADDGRLELIVPRPTKFEREVLEEGELDTVVPGSGRPVHVCAIERPDWS